MAVRKHSRKQGRPFTDRRRPPGELLAALRRKAGPAGEALGEALSPEQLREVEADPVLARNVLRFIHHVTLLRPHEKDGASIETLASEIGARPSTVRDRIRRAEEFIGQSAHALD